MESAELSLDIHQPLPYSLEDIKNSTFSFKRESRVYRCILQGDSNAQYFKKSIVALCLLSEKLFAPILFITEVITEEPGSLSTQRFIFGAVYKSSILFINPLGLSIPLTHEDEKLNDGESVTDSTISCDTHRTSRCDAYRIVDSNVSVKECSAWSPSFMFAKKTLKNLAIGSIHTSTLDAMLSSEANVTLSRMPTSSKATSSASTRNSQSLSPSPVRSPVKTPWWKFILAVTGVIVSCAIIATGLGVIFGGIMGVSAVAAYCMVAMGGSTAIGFSAYAASSLIGVKKALLNPTLLRASHEPGPEVNTTNLYANNSATPVPTLSKTQRDTHTNNGPSSSSSSKKAFTHLVKPGCAPRLEAFDEDESTIEVDEAKNTMRFS